MDADSSCTFDIADKFNSLIIDITKTLSIEDDRSNIVDTLMKIETRLNYLIEARDFLNKRDLSSFPGKKTVTLENFEREQRKKKNQENLERKQKEEEDKQIMLKEKQRERAEKLKDMVLFRGHELKQRSEAKQIKKRKTKKNVLDEEQKNQKEYLGSELFEILKEV